jgi:hypothetical protein
MRKLPPVTVATIERRDPVARARIAQQYDALLESFAVGDYGQASLEPGDTPLAVRRRLDKAADRRGWWLKWVDGHDLVFQVRAVTRRSGAS